MITNSATAEIVDNKKSLMQTVDKKGASASYHDPYCPIVKRGDKIHHSKTLTPDLPGECNAVIITAAHRKTFDYNL